MTRRYASNVSTARGREAPATQSIDTALLVEDDLTEVDRSQSNGFQTPEDARLFISADVTDSTGQTIGMRRTHSYAFGDAFVVQVGVTRYAQWTGTLLDGWHELRNDVMAAFDGQFFGGATETPFGVSVLYWAIRENEPPLLDYAGEVQQIAGKTSDDRFSRSGALLSTATDLGRLWHSNSIVFSEAKFLPQDLWVLVSPSADDALQDEVNRRYFEPGAPFVGASLARHKFVSHEVEINDDRPRLKSEEDALDEWATNLLGSVANLRSPDSERFQEQSKAAAHSLAAYRAHVSELKRLGRTLRIARTNFLTTGATLVSSEAYLRTSQAESQEAEALRFLLEWQSAALRGDEFFLGELGRMRAASEQVDADLDYADWIVERNRAVLQSNTEHLQIAGQHKLAEISHHLSIDSAAVVAALLAFVVVEGLVKPLGMDHVAVAVGAVLTIASLAFTALVWMASGSERKGGLEMGSAALTLALVVTTGWALLSLIGPGGHPIAPSHEEQINELRTALAEHAVTVAGLAAVLWLVLWLTARQFRKPTRGARAESTPVGDQRPSSR